MKLLSCLILFLINLHAWAGEWKVIEKSDHFVMQTPEGKHYSLQSVGGKPKYVKTMDFKKDYRLVIYYAGEAGTSEMVKVYRALLFQKSPHKLLGDWPYSYSSKDKSETQPKWELKDKVLTIEDENSGLEEKIMLP